MLITLALAFYFLYHELSQLNQGFSKACVSRSTFDNNKLTRMWKIIAYTMNDYLRDFWNWLHMATLVLVITTLFSQLSMASRDQGITSGTIAIRSAITMPLLGTEYLFYLGGLKSTGPLIRMIVKIMNGIYGLVVILAVMVFFFAGSYTVLFQENVQEGYAHFQDTCLTVYSMLFDMPDLETYELSSSPALAKLLMVVFLFFVVVVLLNLLIALMGDIYERVQEKGSSEATFGIAKLVMEYESLLSYSYKKKNQAEFFPAWLYIFKRKGVNAKDETVFEEIKDLKEQVGSLENELSSIKNDLSAILQIMKARKADEEGNHFW